MSTFFSFKGFPYSTLFPGARDFMVSWDTFSTNEIMKFMQGRSLMESAVNIACSFGEIPEISVSRIYKTQNHVP